jgi:predicted metal-dependent hydrolase
VEYVVAHEIAHLAEHNHGPRFWALVARAIPDYKKRRQALRKFIL